MHLVWSPILVIQHNMHTEIPCWEYMTNERIDYKRVIIVGKHSLSDWSSFSSTLRIQRKTKKLSTVLWILNIPSQMPFVGFILQEHEESKFWISSLMYYVRWRVFFHILLCLSYKQLIGEEKPGKNTSSGCQHNALKYIYSQSLKLLKNYLHYSCPFAWFHSLGKRTLLK